MAHQGRHDHLIDLSAAPKATRGIDPGRNQSRPGGVGETTALVCLWVLFLIVASSMTMLGGNRPLPWTLLSVGALLLFLISSVACAVRLPRHWASSLAPPAALFATVPVWGLVQATPGLMPQAILHDAWSGLLAHPPLSLDPEATYHQIARLAAYAACFWIAVLGLRRIDAARKFIVLIAVVAAAFSAYGILTLLSGMNPLLDIDPERPPLRLSATYVNPNSFAFVAGMGVLASIACLERCMADAAGESLRWRDALRAFSSRGWLFTVTLLTCLIALFLTGSRGALLSFAVASVAYLALRRQSLVLLEDARLKFGLFLFLGSLLCAGLFLGADLMLKRSLATEGVDQVRGLLWRTTLDAIADRPLTGFGLGAYEEAIRAYASGEYARNSWQKAHNLFLELGLELGLPMLAVWLGAWLLIGARLLRGLAQRRRARDVLAFTIAVSIAGLLHSLVDFPLQMPGTAALFAMVVGMGWAQSWSSRSSA